MYICIFQNLITWILLCITMLTLLLSILLPCNLTLASFTSLLVATGGFATRTFANCHKLGRTVVLLVPLQCDDAVELSAVVCWRWSDGLTAEVDFSSVWTLLALEVRSRTGGTGNGQFLVGSSSRSPSAQSRRKPREYCFQFSCNKDL